jgi:tRNA-Thr(GGU) m(6)t(6)A37 methyltransferase TsaA
MSIRERVRRLFGGASAVQKLEAATATPVALRPIGVVLNGVRDPRRDGWEQVVSEVRLREDLAPALLGLDGYSHVIILFFLHGVPEERRGMPLQIHPRGDERYPLQGVLATRTQHRPNPIGVAVVPLLRVERATLTVRGLDAIDGTPVLDIKPYIPHYDAVAGATVPGWVMGEEER